MRSTFNLETMVEKQPELFMFSAKHLLYLHEDDAGGIHVSSLDPVRSMTRSR